MYCQVHFFHIFLLGSVTDLHSISPVQCIYSTSSGDVGLVSYDTDCRTYHLIQQWAKLHRYRATKEPASCTCVANNGNEIVTGKLRYFNMRYFHLN